MKDTYIGIVLAANVLILASTLYNNVMLRKIPPQARIYSEIAATAVKVEQSKVAIDKVNQEVVGIKESLAEIKAINVLRYQKIEALGQKLSGE